MSNNNMDIKIKTYEAIFTPDERVILLHALAEYISGKSRRGENWTAEYKEAVKKLFKDMAQQ